MRGGGSLRWEPGEWTDDTAMAVGVALAAAEHGALHHPAGLDAVARQFVRWWDSRPKDVGYQTSQVLQWRSADAADMRRRSFELDGLTGGNGSLMRTAPVALCYLDDPDNCARAARAVCGPARRACCGRGRSGMPCSTATTTACAAAWPSWTPISGPRCWTRPNPALLRTFRRTAGWCTRCRRRGGRSPIPNPCRPRSK